MLRWIKQKIAELKRKTLVLIYVYRDKRTPFLSKLLIAIAVGYLLSPIDLIPDFIPILGFLDDLLVVYLLYKLAESFISEVLIKDAEEKMQNKPIRKLSKNWIVGGIIVVIWGVALWYFFQFFMTNW